MGAFEDKFSSPAATCRPNKSKSWLMRAAAKALSLCRWTAGSPV
jgi:hypothetical protein